MSSLDPIVLSVEMTDQGYWRVTWSLRAGLRLAVTCTKVGISRSEAVQASSEALPAYVARVEGHRA